MRLSAFGEWHAGRSAAATDSGPFPVTGDISAGADAVNRMPEIIGFRQAGA